MSRSLRVVDVVVAVVVRVCDCVQETSKSERKEGVPGGYELRDRLGRRHGSSSEPRGASNNILLREIGTHLVRRWEG